MAEQTRRATTVVQTGANWHNVAHACDENVDSSYAYRKASGTSACHIKGFNFNIPSNATVTKVTVAIKWYASNSHGYLYAYLRSIASGKYINIAKYADGNSKTTPGYNYFDVSSETLQNYVNNNNVYNKNIIELINGGLYLRWVGSSNSSSYSSEVRIYDTYITVNYKAPYAVNFNGNGATSGSVSSISQNVSTEFSLPANGFEKRYAVKFDPNYSGSSVVTVNSTASFKGWEDHGTIKSSSGETFTSAQFDAPFYANTYGDLYNAFKYNKQSLIDHYVDYGRNEGRQCTGNPRGIYPPGAVVNSLANEGGNTTLYAQWSEMSAVALPSQSRDGYTFLGWYTAASGGTKVGNGGENYIPNGNITLYGHWQLNEITDIYIGTSILDVYIGSAKVDVYQGTTKIYG